MLGYAEKDGQTWFSRKPSSHFLKKVSFSIMFYGNSRNLVLSLTQPTCFPALWLYRLSVWCCLTGPKKVPYSWDARDSRWHGVAHVIVLPHSLWTWGL
jgi:hypothetical protein